MSSPSVVNNSDAEQWQVTSPVSVLELGGKLLVIGWGETPWAEPSPEWRLENLV